MSWGSASVRCGRPQASARRRFSEYVRRAKVVGITWPIPPEIGDAALEGLLFTPAGFHEGLTRPLPIGRRCTKNSSVAA